MALGMGGLHMEAAHVGMRSAMIGQKKKRDKKTHTKKRRN
jgi:hypothetical protein